jgi:hypothetical protein
MRALPKLFALLVAVFLSSHAQADSYVYVVTGASQFGTVDVNNGAFNAIGSPLAATSGGLVQGAGGSLLTLGTDGNLYSINPSTGAETLIGATGIGINAFSLAQVNGIIYATDLGNNIYTVNPVTGAATFLSATGIPPDQHYPFTTDPSNGYTYLCDETLYGVGNSLYATYDEIEVSPDGSTFNTLTSADLWKIDPATGLATKIAPTDLMLDGSFYENGSLYAFFANGNPPNNFFAPQLQIESIDLSNGTTHFVTDVDPAAVFINGAIPDVPEPPSIILLGTGLVGVAMRVRNVCQRIQRPS